MNNTNRALNRVGIFLFGLVLLVVGSAVAVTAAVPAWFTAWRSGSKGAATTTTDTISRTQLGSTGQSWFVLVVPIVALILVVLLLAFIFRQGHGHTGTLLTKQADAAARVGSVIVNSAIAERTITSALEEYPGIATSSVSSYRVRGIPMLNVTVSARRGVTPTDIRDYVERIVERFDEVLGEEIPVFLKINGGFASRRASAARLPEQSTS